MKSFKWSKPLTLVMVAVWLAAIVAAFYWYFWQFVRPFDAGQLYPNGQVVEQPLLSTLNPYIEQSPDAEILVFHWLKPDCLCSRFSGVTISGLAAADKGSSTRHWVLTPPGQSEAAGQILPETADLTIRALGERQYRQSLTAVPAAPSAVVYYRKTGTISYLGPHSSGVVCGSGTGFVELVLNNLQHGFDPQLYELEQKGCFCAW